KMTQQANAGELLSLLESPDLQVLEEIRGVINDNLDTVFALGQVVSLCILSNLVGSYTSACPKAVTRCLSSVAVRMLQHLLDKMNECMGKAATRLATLTLLGHVIRRQPSWIHKISRASVLLSLLKCLKNLTFLLSHFKANCLSIKFLVQTKSLKSQCLYNIHTLFISLSSWWQSFKDLKQLGHVPEVYLVHLHASVYALFHRLYGMYPCNFVSYLRSHYGMKENMETFDEVVKPMLEHVRIHPELVTGTKDHELDPTRWKRFETHDIVIECAKVSLDPKEASCEEGYVTIPEHFSTHFQHRQSDPGASPFTDMQSSYASNSLVCFLKPRSASSSLLLLSNVSGLHPQCQSPLTVRRITASSVWFSCLYVKEILWSPSSMCGMSTPPSSRGMSPTNVPSEMSHSTSQLSSRVYSTPGGGEGKPETGKPSLSRQQHVTGSERGPVSLPPNPFSIPSSGGALPTRVKGLLRGGNPAGPGLRTPKEACNETMKMVTLEELPEVIHGLSLQHDSTEKEKEEAAAISEELSEITVAERESPHFRGGFDSPFYRTTENLTGCQRKLPLSCSGQGRHLSSENPAISAPGKPGQDIPTGTPRQDQCSLKQQMFTPIEMPAESSYGSSVGNQDGHGASAYSVLTPSPYKAKALKNSSFSSGKPLPYEYFFDLALPKTASLFVSQKTAELLKKAQGHPEEKKELCSSTSPLEVLDRLIQQGEDAHVKELNRLPLPSKSADWTHFGGSAPLDELQTLRNQLVLLHNQLLYERYKREQHAIRNRRLLRKIINATALEEQNAAMKDQLKLQEMDIQSLKCSLQKEQLRHQKHQEEHEMVGTQLHSQIRLLQNDQQELCARNQELQSKLQDCQKVMGELRVQLQKANNTVCTSGHLVNQLTQKLSSSESIHQQMEFLNKQLLLLGEVNELYTEQLLHAQKESSKELEMIHLSHRRELEEVKFCVQQQSQRLDASQKRIVELESQLTKKEHLFLEQKKYLEDVKGHARGELQAAESRYQAQKRITQTLEVEILELYSRLEKEGVLKHPLTKSVDTGEVEFAEVAKPAAERFPSVFLKGGNIDTKTSGQTKPPKTPSISSNNATLTQESLHGTTAHKTESVNGSRIAPLLLEPATSGGMTPITVGSYPSSKSFLGMRNRELFRNKSESQCDEQSVKIASLSDSLKTELCKELGSSEVQGPLEADVPIAPQTSSQQSSVQQLRIMDYNETQHDHS
uniref:TSC complex subunit 1 n=1 Tax=Latimeria chalumnae TaxID=7897 RepID=H3ATH5_LATCH